MAAAHGLRGVWSASDLRHEPSANLAPSPVVQRAAAPSGPPPEASGTALSDVRQAIPLEAARQPLLLVALPAEGLSPTAGGGHSPRSAALRRASSPSPSASAVPVDPRLPEQWIGGALQLPHQRIDPPPRDQPALAPRLPQPAGQPHKLVELRRAADRHPFRPELLELRRADVGAIVTLAAAWLSAAAAYARPRSGRPPLWSVWQPLALAGERKPLR